MSQHPPNKIIFNNNIITSPVKICNIAVRHFVNKISNIREKFNKPKFDPIDILKNLVPKCNNKMKFPKITKNKTLKIIDNLKPTNSRGHDDITNKIIKLIKYDIEPIITRLINQIIDTEIFPDILKISR